MLVDSWSDYDCSEQRKICQSTDDIEGEHWLTPEWPLGPRAQVWPWLVPSSAVYLKQGCFAKIAFTLIDIPKGDIC